MIHLIVRNKQRFSKERSAMMEIDESDCCGNGCANCILDMPKPTERIIRKGKKNILLNYTKFKLLSRKTHAVTLEDILELHFSCAEIETADLILDIPAGHHIMMRATIPDVTTNEEVNLLRPYSPYWVDVTKLEFKIIVHLRMEGRMSQYIANLQEGAEVEFRGPIGTYTHKPAAGKRIFIVSQGIAIAPTLPIVEEVLHNEDDMSRIVHLACFSDLAHIYFRKCLREFSMYWNYKSRIYLSHANCGNKMCLQVGCCTNECEALQRSLYYKELVFARRLTTTEIVQICEDIGSEEQQNVFIICGTRQFQNFVADSIRKSNAPINEKNIYLL